MGSVKSFAGVDFEHLTGGAINLTTLLEENNLMCFALQIVKLAAPTWTNNLFATLGEPVGIILESLATPLVSLECPAWDWLEGGGENILEVLKEYQIPGTGYGLL